MTALSNADKVKEFHESMKMTIGVWPPTEQERMLRRDLIREESEEVDTELVAWHNLGAIPLNKQKLAKELADLLYVVYGTAVSFGIPINEVFEEVHRSNMSKLVDGKPSYREDGKVLKGPNYQPPKLDHIFK